MELTQAWANAAYMRSVLQGRPGVPGRPKLVALAAALSRHLPVMRQQQEMKEQEGNWPSRTAVLLAGGSFAVSGGLFIGFDTAVDATGMDSLTIKGNIFVPGSPSESRTLATESLRC